METHFWMTTDSVRADLQQTQANHGGNNVVFFDSGPGKLLHSLIYFLACPVMMLVAISTNLINVTVFLRAGLNDGMTITFLGLAVSDLLYNVFYCMGRLLNAVHSVFGSRPYLNTFHLSYIFAKHGRMWFNVSVLLTVYAAIQKTACIAIPLTFRSFFTRRKSAITVIAIYLAVVTYFLPFLTLDQLQPYMERGTNRTRLGYSLRNRNMAGKIQDFVTYANRIILPYVSQGIVVICVIVITFKLRSAAETRRKMTSTNNDCDTDLNDETVGSVGDEKGKKNAESGRTNNSGSGVLSLRELRVIRSVNILCAIFIAGTTPQTIIGAFNLAFPEFGDFGAYYSVYTFTQAFQQLMEITSTAVNILVYYHFNSKYRRTFEAIFKRNIEDTNSKSETQTS
ncbi:hypothetical protein EGW08_022177 [Elysia chlorotica]|uniref:G-protein coupled receptors family 1 profile domain-containing protein n=1 Tax=Elysia chlorotica TaxID=188477 RepID=A0A3S0ZLB8_ELYCH|nr:hypothetical protein EGW08_022177 [Elysia chlorotica]